MNHLDQVILVDDQDNEIGVMDKVEAHRGEAKLHRAISVYLFNDKGELLIQQRSAQKIVGAGQWANTCCGNVRPGETYEQCAYRRLKEELGITGATLQPIHKFQYFARCNEEFSEREIDQVFVGRYQADPQPNPDEVQSTSWINFDQLVNRKEKDRFGDKMLAPWFVIMLENKELIEKVGAV